MDIFKIIPCFGGGGFVTLSAAAFWGQFFKQTGGPYFAWLAILTFIMGSVMTALTLMPDNK